ncbi:MAG: hypothetical protein JW891_04975 [Candidatus Lokiarchaeota archaeon]|nr:hypothetical protein [Candidatus Lokiarchaeota archaeon]
MRWAKRSIIYKGKEIFGRNIPIEKIDLIFITLEKGEIFEKVSLDVPAWRIFSGLTVPELHDRTIVSMYKRFNAEAILTNDAEIAEAATIIWE